MEIVLKIPLTDFKAVPLLVKKGLLARTYIKRRRAKNGGFSPKDLAFTRAHYDAVRIWETLHGGKDMPGSSFASFSTLRKKGIKAYRRMAGII